MAHSSPGRGRATERSVAHPDRRVWAISHERRDLLRHPLPRRDAAKPDGSEQAQRWCLSQFRLEKNARCSSFLQPVHAREEQRTPESTPLLSRARPNHPDFADRIFATAVRYPGEFTETKRGKRPGGIDRNYIQVGLVGLGLVIVKSHADPIKHCLMQLLVALQLLPMHATAQGKTRWQVNCRQGDIERANQAQISRRKRSETGSF